MRDQFKGKIYGLGSEEESADSRPEFDKQAWIIVLAQLDQAINAEILYTTLREDSLPNSYCQSFHDLGRGSDSEIGFEEYERTAEEEDHLGLTDMKTKLNKYDEYVRDTLIRDKKLEDLTDGTGKETA